MKFRKDLGIILWYFLVGIPYLQKVDVMSIAHYSDMGVLQNNVFNKCMRARKQWPRKFWTMNEIEKGPWDILTIIFLGRDTLSTKGWSNEYCLILGYGVIAK